MSSSKDDSEPELGRTEREIDAMIAGGKPVTLTGPPAAKTAVVTNISGGIHARTVTFGPCPCGKKGICTEDH